MPVNRKNGRFAPDPAPMLPVPIGDPIDTYPGSKIHRVVCYVPGESHQLADGSFTIARLAVTACRLQTGRLRQSYPTSGVPCPICWPNGICCPLKRPRPLVDNTEYIKIVPF